ncbi:hypothetical protein MHO82_23310 [Vibrio sp. Of7-15]|uniref:hypothetical protein n=1 Tax=Vibrio sp. Of7-15 TaxID=2724879 RepID=UPI001EF2B110|nr:hypothetical protein [Vibrio sp. Of7-15]MCG7499800.1 hypothetical protein [Vibrio sp. Of7-15]
MKNFLIYLGIIVTVLIGYNLIPAKYPTTYFGTESSLDSLINTGLFYPMCLKENAYVIRKNPFPINENELLDMDNIRINNTLTKYNPILESYLNKNKTDWFKELSYKATSVSYGILGSDKYMKYINDNTILRLTVSEDKKTSIH